jgi:putative phosphoesterase
MTKVGCISDVHGDVHALRDALKWMKKIGCSQIVCGGDLVDYGLFPNETLDILRSEKIPCIRGNHDRWAVRGDTDVTAWDLSDASLAFLKSLPEKLALVVDGIRIVLWHARPDSDMDGIYPDKLIEMAKVGLLDTAEADVLVVGHTHLPMVVDVRDRGLIVNPGALLRDPGPGVSLPAPGTFGVLDTAEMEFEIYRSADGRPGRYVRG